MDNLHTFIAHNLCMQGLKNGLHTIEYRIKRVCGLYFTRLHTLMPVNKGMQFIHRKMG